MIMAKVTLIPLTPDDREQFIRDNQEAFNYGAVDAFGAAPETKTRVDVLSIEGTAAAVRVTLEDWHGLAFTDFHTLIKEDGQWKILAKVFHQYL